jgi:hypothetical protein
MNIGMTANENVDTDPHELVASIARARSNPLSSVIPITPDNKSDSPTCMPKESVTKNITIARILMAIGSIKCLPPSSFYADNTYLSKQPLIICVIIKYSITVKTYVNKNMSAYTKLLPNM